MTAIGGVSALEQAEAWLQSQGGRDAVVARLLTAGRPEAEDRDVLASMGAPPGVLALTNSATYYARRAVTPRVR